MRWLKLLLNIYTLLEDLAGLQDLMSIVLRNQLFPLMRFIVDLLFELLMTVELLISAKLSRFSCLWRLWSILKVYSEHEYRNTLQFDLKEQKLQCPSNEMAWSYLQKTETTMLEIQSLLTVQTICINWLMFEEWDKIDLLWFGRELVNSSILKLVFTVYIGWDVVFQPSEILSSGSWELIWTGMMFRAKHLAC